MSGKPGLSAPERQNHARSSKRTTLARSLLGGQKGSERKPGQSQGLGRALGFRGTRVKLARSATPPYGKPSTPRPCCVLVAERVRTSRLPGQQVRGGVGPAGPGQSAVVPGDVYEAFMPGCVSGPRDDRRWPSRRLLDGWRGYSCRHPEQGKPRRGIDRAA